ncbi:MAG: hypothetical protein ACTSP5_12090, partial [Candidatus Heimdallarchaeota archaeon]
QKSYQKVLIRLILKSKDINKEQLITTIQSSIQQVYTNYNCLIPSIDIRFESPVMNPNSNKLIRIQRDFVV